MLAHVFSPATGAKVCTCTQVLDLGHCMIGERGVSELANSAVDILSKTKQSRLRWLLLSNNNAGSVG